MSGGGRRALGPGGRLDRYELVSLVVESRVARLWLGRLDGKHGFSRLVAVQTLAPALASDPPTRAAFLDWVRTLSAIEHPNVAQILDLGVAGGVPYAVMEWIDGTTLDRITATRAPIPSGVALRVIADVCAGLHATHELRDATGRATGAVHGDVSSRHVMVTRAGVAKLVGFGVARAAADRHADVQATCVLMLRLLGATPRADGGHAEIPATFGGATRDTLRRALSMDSSQERPTADDLQWALESEMAMTAERSSTQDVARWLGEEGLVPARPSAISVARGAAGDAPAPAEVGPASGRRAWTARRVVAAVTAGALAVAIIAAAIAHRASAGAPTSPSAVATADAEAHDGGVGAVTDLPLPASSNPDALAAYGAAMRSYRQGATLAALTSFDRAVQLDPSLAAAHLRIAVLGLWSPSSRAVEHFALASTLRHSLSDHDEALLHAFEPIVQRVPSDYAEAARRFSEARRRFPDDAELAVRSAMCLPYASPAAIAELRVATSIDPHFAGAFSTLGEMLSYAERYDDALRTAQACLDAIPDAAQCFRVRTAIEEQFGQCAALEVDARRQSASDPANFYSLRDVANAAYAQGAPLQTAIRLLDDARGLMEPSMAARTQAEDDYAAAVLSGDLARAERAARAELELVASDPTKAAHGRAARRLVRVLLEQGDDAGAASAADDFLRRASGWQAEPRNEDFAMARDPTPILLGVVRRAGRLSEGELAARRDAWLSSLKPPDPLGMLNRYLWAHAWAAPAESEAEAVAAMAAQKDYGPPPRYAPESFLVADVGRTLFLAGHRDDEALGWLRGATQACSAFDFPVEHVRAYLWLGRALEERREQDAACQAYAVVSAIWGGARRRSVTAEEARRRARSLHCPV